jgi:CheY-like chemotaxis protein
MTSLSTDDQVQLRNALSSSFSLEELETLAFDLGIEDGAIRATNKDPYVINLIRYCERREGYMGCLIDKALFHRPTDPVFKRVVNKVSPCPKTRYVQIQFAPNDESRLIQDILDLAQRYPQQITVVGNGSYLQRETNRKILVVDDEVDWQLRIGHLIEDIGYEAIPVGKADDVSQMPDEQLRSFALITIDLRLSANLDEVQGLTLFQQLRERGVKTPCVLISANLTKEVVIAVLNDTGYGVKVIDKTQCADVKEMRNFLRGMVNEV